MTNVRCENDRQEYVIDIEGHSGYNPGNDIVCAQASILAYTLCNMLSNQPTEYIDTQIDDGNMHIKVIGTRESWQYIKTIVETIMLGYELLEEQFPENISVEW